MTSRKLFSLLALIVVVIASPTFSQVAAKKPEPAKPIAALAWLIGGTWIANASNVGGPGMRIETRYQWSDNNAYIRFNTHFVSDKAAVHRYDGNFFWSPEQSTLAMWYMDPANTITQGPVKLEGEVMEMTFRGTDFEGKQADFRVKVTRKTNDLYNWLLEEKSAEGWRQLLTLDYQRAPAS
jgi:hypothetical protein